VQTVRGIRDLRPERLARTLRQCRAGRPIIPLLSRRLLSRRSAGRVRRARRPPTQWPGTGEDGRVPERRRATMHRRPRIENDDPGLRPHGQVPRVPRLRRGDPEGFTELPLWHSGLLDLSGIGPGHGQVEGGREGSRVP
jgi:hypothetical protein